MKQVRRIILLILVILAGLTLTANAQDFKEVADNWTVGGINIQDDSLVNFVTVEYTIANMIRYVSVDYGQNVSSVYAYGKKTQIRDKWQRKIKFKGEMQIIDFFTKQGWEHVDTDKDIDRGTRFTYITFKR